MSMKFEDARAAIFARLNTYWAAAHPTIPVDYENRMQVDLATQVPPFITCELALNDGAQVSIEAAPVVRYAGAIYLAVWVREGGGSKQALELLGELSDQFKTTRFSGVTTQAPRPLPAQHKVGWLAYAVRVPFWFDDTPA